MLTSSTLVGFVATTDLPRAGALYRDVLGLSVVEESPVATVFDANGASLRVTAVEDFSPAPFTVLAWVVADIVTALDTLAARGLRFERFPGLEQDERGVWTTPGGDRVAWFKDPDGNVLSLTEAVASPSS